MINSKKINKAGKKNRILIAPLDWGLGHTTRCIPLITHFLLHDIEVFIAAEGASSQLLKNEFPELFFLELPGYRIKYSRKKFFLPLKLAVQIPKILFSIYKEHRWLKKVIKKYKINAVISDNRLGLYTKKISCIYLTHQLLIRTGNSFTQKIAQHIHYWFINKYDECWVPDFEKISLAGNLSHPFKLPKKVKYIGALSRLEKIKEISEQYDLLIIISGPEPQRSILEKTLLTQLKNFDGNFLFVKGLPNSKIQPQSNLQNGKIINHLPAKELSEAIQKSKIVISRSGYTTIMDLVKLQRKAILIPTPGQTEQEYLAEYLMEKKIFYSVPQKNFVLSEALKQAETFSFKIPACDMDQYKNTVNNFIKTSLPYKPGKKIE